MFCVKFFADGDEDLEPDTWSPIGIWRASLITIVQQMPSSQFGQTRRPSNWDNWSLAAESNRQYYNQIVTVVMTISVASSFGFIFWNFVDHQLLGLSAMFWEKKEGGRVISYLGTVVTTTPGLYWPLQGRPLSFLFFIFYLTFFSRSSWQTQVGSQGIRTRQ